MDKAPDHRKSGFLSRRLRILSFLSLILLFQGFQIPGFCQKKTRLVFTGDILLSRNVAREIIHSKVSPWVHLLPDLRPADFIFGNLEGAIADPSSGNSHDSASSLVFGIPPSFVPYLDEAGFTALSTENNHSMDLGIAGKERTRRLLHDSGIETVSFENSPRFFNIGGTVIAMVAINLIGDKDNGCQKIPSVALSQKMRLAKNLANLVVVSIHWGSELLDWPDMNQRNTAKWLISNGADMIIGHHPHVIQAPVTIDGKPVFFSLGNHLFDQKYPATKEGLMVDCTIENGRLSYQCLKTHTASRSFFPVMPDQLPSDTGSFSLRGNMKIAGIFVRALPSSDLPAENVALEGIFDGKQLWHTKPMSMVSAEVAKLDGKNDFMMTLERHYSNLDGENGLRPYVYSVVRSGLNAKWRGSALAWPLLDAFVIPGHEGLLCALHRNDSFINPDPAGIGTRTAVYRWNGFGFSGVDEEKVCAECAKLLFPTN